VLSFQVFSELCILHISGMANLICQHAFISRDNLSLCQANFSFVSGRVSVYNNGRVVSKPTWNIVNKNSFYVMQHVNN